MGKRLKAAALCCVLAACMVPALTGCSNNKTTYTPETKSPVVASPAIGQDGTLRVGVDAENPPLSGMVESDNTSKIAGLDVDVAAALADEPGTEAVHRRRGQRSRGGARRRQGGHRHGHRPVARPTWHSGARTRTCRRAWCCFRCLPTRLCPRRPRARRSLRRCRRGAPGAVMNEFGEESLTSTNNLVEALNALSTGTVQYVAADAVRGVSAAKQPHVDVHMIALMQQPGGYCVGVADENSELQDGCGRRRRHPHGQRRGFRDRDEVARRDARPFGPAAGGRRCGCGGMTQDTGPAAEGTAGGDAGSKMPGMAAPAPKAKGTRRPGKPPCRPSHPSCPAGVRLRSMQRFAPCPVAVPCHVGNRPPSLEGRQAFPCPVGSCR